MPEPEGGFKKAPKNCLAEIVTDAFFGNWVLIHYTQRAVLFDGRVLTWGWLMELWGAWKPSKSIGCARAFMKRLQKVENFRKWLLMHFERYFERRWWIWTKKSATVRSFIKTFRIVYIHKLLVICPIIGFCSYIESALSRGNHKAFYTKGIYP